MASQIILDWTSVWFYKIDSNITDNIELALFYE